MQQLTLNKLIEYNLFSNKKNKIILRAIFISTSEIRIYIKKHLTLNDIIQLYNQNNEKITNFKLSTSEDKTFVTLFGVFNLNSNYIVKINNEITQVILNPEIDEILDTDFYSTDTDLGVFIKNTIAYFKVWSPPAIKVELLLFNENQTKINTSESLFLLNTKLGIWEYQLEAKTINRKSFDGIYYQYKIVAYEKEYIALDPYAKSMSVFDSNSEDIIGKGAIIDFESNKINPSDFIKTYSNNKFIENETDIIAYEINVRDFTIQPGVVSENIAGTFKGLTKKVDYLKELGITHIQLMPVNKAYTQNELNRTFTGKSAKESNYNWGYDPMNYFTLEGRYSTNPQNPYTRIYEFKEMVKEMNNAGIGVILDVVFNHTYIADTFENIAPGCYYRLNEDYTISGHTGAGPSLESRRKQVQKFIIDVLKFYVTEYHIDGFRFDLMSFTDKETMKQIREEVGKTYNSENPNELILQGEAWIFTDLEKDAVVKTDFDSLNIGIFNDTFRDAVAGTGKEFGFVQGNSEEGTRLASAIIGGIQNFDSESFPFNKEVFFDSYNLFAKQPSDCLNFLSVHDGLTLWDKINLSIKDESKKERLRIMKFAYAILFTSQGKIILHSGDEILRTKPLADFDNEKTRAFTSGNIDKEENSTHFHENSYCSNDYTNMFRWNRLTDAYSEFTYELLEYVKGLIKMRRRFSAFRMNTSEEINKNIEFLSETVSDYKIHSFKSYKLEKLKISFINGIPGKSYYLTGEIHKNNHNPVYNPFKLHFDEFGNAEILFNKKEIGNFDLHKWDNTQNLNFKLVKTAGEWVFPNFSYSEFGHNSISPECINENFEIFIDLSIKDFKKLNSEKLNPNNYIAYKIKQNQKKQFIVIHNPNSEILQLAVNELQNPEKWAVLLDNNNSGIELIKNSEIKITSGKISVPRNSSAVIIKK